MEIGGTVFRHCRCELCRRDFIEDTATGERRAVNVSAFDFIRLDREVSDRWLNEPCPKTLTPSDEVDRLKLAWAPRLYRIGKAGPACHKLLRK